jgi:hypothetical protein
MGVPNGAYDQVVFLKTQIVAAAPVLAEWIQAAGFVSSKLWRFGILCG